MLQEAEVKTTGDRRGRVSSRRHRSHVNSRTPGYNRQPTPETPNRSQPHQMDTPASEPQFLDAPGSQRIDPNYDPPDTPRSRRELWTMRPQPPITRIQSRLQSLQEASEEDNY